MWRPALAGLIVCVCSPVVSATVVVPVEFREIVNDARLIVRGHITDVRAFVAPGLGIESVATVAVQAVLKGTAESFVSVRVPGGTVGRSRVVMIGAPTLRSNERAIFFLVRDAENAWRPLGLSSGVVRIEREPATGRQLVRPPVLLGRTASVGRVVRGDWRRTLLPVDEFESIVRVVLSAKGNSRAGAAE
jgi:hypothetical protein